MFNATCVQIVNKYKESQVKGEKTTAGDIGSKCEIQF